MKLIQENSNIEQSFINRFKERNSLKYKKYVWEYRKLKNKKSLFDFISDKISVENKKATIQYTYSILWDLNKSEVKLETTYKLLSNISPKLVDNEVIKLRKRVKKEIDNKNIITIKPRKRTK